MKKISYAFFGTGALAESVMASLYHAGFIPKLIVTKPDSAQGRHLQIIAPHIKTWGELKNIKVFQPESLKNLTTDSPLHTEKFDVFIVASYGKIIPEEILNLPQKGVLNVHPSLLPKYRGPSPIESALLDGERAIGISIIKLDNEMDHGPILAQNTFTVDDQANVGMLEVTCGQLGGELLTQVLSPYIDGNLIPKEQDHLQATICKKIIKELGEINLETSSSIVRNKFRALTPWPSIYFYVTHNQKQIRVKVTNIDLTTPTTEETTAKDIILKVIPEGKKEMDFKSFALGYLN